MGVLDWLDKTAADGRIRYPGFPSMTSFGFQGYNRFLIGKCVRYSLIFWMITIRPG